MSDQQWLEDIIEAAIAEDIGSGDVTTNAIIDDQKTAKAVWLAKQDGIIAGLDIAKKVFHKLDKNLEWNPLFKDGDEVRNREALVEIKGRCRALLTAERVALNFAQRMSGIATKTAEMVRLLEGLPTKILDTRKTVPGLRMFDKLAVEAGGGVNHRMGLYDMAMIKDNHIVAAGSITEAVKRVRNSRPDVKIEVETTTADQIDEALRAGADMIMFDNMTTEQMRKAVQQVANRAKTEASGNINSDTLRQVAETGVDYISMGALTHSVKAFDISQQLIEIF